MKSGATFIVAVRSDVQNINTVSKAIFTLKGNETLTKDYPSEVRFSDGSFLIPLTQEETMKLATDKGHTVLVEGQFNFADKSVAKSETVKTYISSTLATEIVDGNAPSAYQLDEIQISIMDGVIIARVNVEDVEEAVARAEAMIASANSMITESNRIMRESEEVIDAHNRAIRVAEAAALNASNKADYADYEGDQAKAKGDYAEQKTAEMQENVSIAIQNAENAASNALQAAEEAGRVNANASKSAGVATIEITDKNNNIHIVKVFDGDKGDRGERGEKGEKGDTYEITQDDYNAIADIAVDSVDFSGKVSEAGVAIDARAQQAIATIPANLKVEDGHLTFTV